MTFEKLREILLDMGIFKMKGSMLPPNNRVIFECIPLRIIVTPNECEVMYDHLLYWTFNLKRIATKELFAMLDEYFPQENEDYDMTWSSMVEPDLGFGDVDKWKAFKSKWIRAEKIEELI